MVYKESVSPCYADGFKIRTPSTVKGFPCQRHLDSFFYSTPEIYFTCDKIHPLKEYSRVVLVWWLVEWGFGGVFLLEYFQGNSLHAMLCSHHYHSF